ncbi:hypothetical protein GWI33_013162, partial [Rhynchophorus ferrugineus]
ATTRPAREAGLDHGGYVIDDTFLSLSERRSNVVGKRLATKNDV